MKLNGWRPKKTGTEEVDETVKVNHIRGKHELLDVIMLAKQEKFVDRGDVWQNGEYIFRILSNEMDNNIHMN